jgi:hypothetical protein
MNGPRRVARADALIEQSRRVRELLVETANELDRYVAALLAEAERLHDAKESPGG